MAIYDHIYLCMMVTIVTINYYLCFLFYKDKICFKKSNEIKLLKHCMHQSTLWGTANNVMQYLLVYLHAN